MTIVLNTLLALPGVRDLRRVLLPFLPDDPRRRRRRAYTTGGLSPLSARSLMPPPVEERRPPITPQLAVRVAVLGGVAFVLFAIVFFRLWFLQVLTGEDYVGQARENRVRKVRIEAPRGDIVDRNGATLVKTRVAPVVQIVPSRLPESRARAGRRLPQGARARPRAALRGRRRSCDASSASCATTGANEPRPRRASCAG